MEISDLIGEEKAFEPPFKIDETIDSKTIVIVSSNNNPLLEVTDTDLQDKMILYHICNLLNKEHCDK